MSNRILKSLARFNLAIAGPVYRQHSVLLFPSVWDELISSGTGGSAELFVDGESGFVFKSEDAQDLAEKLRMVLRNPRLASDMGLKGLDICRKKYQFSDMLTTLQKHL